MLMAGELESVSTKQEELTEFFELITAEMSEAQLVGYKKLFSDLMRLPNRIQSAKALAEALTKLQTLERTAFSLEDATPKDRASDAIVRMTDAERAVRLMDMLQLKGEKH